MPIPQMKHLVYGEGEGQQERQHVLPGGRGGAAVSRRGGDRADSVSSALVLVIPPVPRSPCQPSGVGVGGRGGCSGAGRPSQHQVVADPWPQDAPGWGQSSVTSMSSRTCSCWSLSSPKASMMRPGILNTETGKAFYLRELQAGSGQRLSSRGHGVCKKVTIGLNL